MFGALTFLLIGSLLQGVLCGDWRVIVPQKVEVVKGSCVTIPCSFDVPDEYVQYLNSECRAIWIKKDSRPWITLTQAMTGDLTNKDCTSTFNNMIAENSHQYYFRLDCSEPLLYNFADRHVNLVVTDDPPAPNLTLSPLEVKEGSSVSLTCSAPAPCQTLPPTLTWTPSLGDVQEQLQENVDKTKVKRSVLTFTASHLHHGQIISCTVVYKKQDGSRDASERRSLTAAVSYSPKDTTVSVSPSGPVQQSSNVTLTCTSNANPAVKSFTWYRDDGNQETVIGTKAVLNIQASKVSRPLFCEAANGVGVGRSNLSQIDVQFPPQILPSSDCTTTAGQVNCSCETVGNPFPTLHWSLDGQPVSQSDKFVISSERLHNDKVLRSFITVTQPQEMNRSTLICHSFNSLGSASHGFFLEGQVSAESHDRLLMPLFISTTALLFTLVCVLLCVIRALKNRQNPNSHLTEEINQIAKRQHVTTEANEVPNTEEHIYVNTERQPNANDLPTVSEPDSKTGPSSGPNNAERVGKSSEKNDEESNVVYSTVSWKSKNKKGADSANMNPSGGSCLEEEKSMVGGVGRNFMSNALEMGNLYDEVGPRNVRKEAECEYAQVKMKGKRAKKK
ncbi:B-cell receptor CD22 [Amphiprion ocellaris]|uniref:B-cell receptor CD22 n=1 Tax=Amphiprion ocellaris TaxID=80972 RepID=UPI002410E293|nr:B-cell receptor CD22 [Amphiprion ocellaris]